MGNEESQLGQAGAAGFGGGTGLSSGYQQQQADPRNVPTGSFRPPPTSSPFTFAQPNVRQSAPPFNQVGVPFNTQRTTTPQRFFGSNAAIRLTTPSAVSNSGPRSNAPTGVDVDLSGLSEAEKRQIAQVMERAQALQDMESMPQMKLPSAPPSATKTTSRLFTGSNEPAHVLSSQNRQTETKPTVSSGDHKRVSSLPPTLSSSSSRVQDNGANLITSQNWPPPLSTTISATPNRPSPVETGFRPKYLAEQDHTLSRSFSSDEQLCSPEFESTRVPLALPAKWQEDPSKPVGLSSSVVPESRSSTTAAQVERCPLCRVTELKIVTVHGKPQPLIGQLCARCSLIVCSKCGKVKKSSDQKTAYWLCTQCVDMAWSPPSELDFTTKPDHLHDHSSSSPSRVHHQDSYVAPLTHLVTADNTVQSDAVRSSPALFFDDEPSYATLPVATAGPPANEPAMVQEEIHYSDEEVWPTDYGNSVYAEPSQETPLSRFRSDSQLHEVSVASSRLVFDHERDDEQQYYNRQESPPERQFHQPEQPSNWERQEPSHQDLFPPPIPIFSSQDSIYDIQEEETSDYGSQIQAACSDIASLSTSTSGGDFGNGNRNWQQPNHHWLESNVNNNKTDKAPAETDTNRGVPLRRSNLVENFRSMPSTNVMDNNTQFSQPRHPLDVVHGNRTTAGQQEYGTQVYSVNSRDAQQIYQQPQPQPPQQQRKESPRLPEEPVNVPHSFPSAPQQPPRTQTGSSGSTGQSAGWTHPAPVVGTSSLKQAPPTTALQSGFQQTRQTYNAGPITIDIHEQQANQIQNTPSSGQGHQLRDVSGRNETSQIPGSSTAPSTSNPSNAQELPVNINARPGEEKKAYYPDSSVGLRRLIHQGSRDDLLSGTVAGSEIDEFDSALESVTDGNAADFDTISQCSQLSAVSASTLAQSSSQLGLNRDTSMERRQKRRLPLPPKDDQAGLSVTPEERERQKKELKRRLSGNLLRITQDEPPSVDGVPRPSVEIASWPTEPPDGAKVLVASKVAKRKKHKHLPQIPQDHDAPKVQQLKQQLRMLAARKAGTGFEDEKRFGSLPNNPLNRFKSISGDEASSSTEYLTDSTFRSKPPVNSANSRNHYASDPALFRSILDQYHRVAQEEKREKELLAGGWSTRQESKEFNFGENRSLQLQPHSDPEIQEIVARLQQFNRDLAVTKELFRSTSNSLERRHVPRWKSDADLANRSYGREPDWQHRVPSRHGPARRHDPYLVQTNGMHGVPFGSSRAQMQAARLDFRDGVRDISYDQYNGYHNDEYFDDRLPWEADQDFEQFNRFERDFRRQAGEQQFRNGRWVVQEPVFHQQYDNNTDVVRANYLNDLNYGAYNQPWTNNGFPIGPNTVSVDPTFLLPLPYLEATQYPGFNPMQDIDNEDLSLYEPFDDPNFLPMGAGAIQLSKPVQSQPPQMQASQPTRQVNFAQTNGTSESFRPAMGPSSLLDAPLFDSRVSYSDEPGRKPVDLGANGAWEEEKENLSDTGSDALNSTEKLSRSVSVKKPKKADPRPKYAFATKRILLTRDPKDRSVSGNGLGVRIAGGKLIPNTQTLGAFISKIWDNGIMATLDEVKEGDQVLEWNGIPLTNKSYEEVQEILDAGNGEVEMLLRCDYNVRHLEAEVDQTRDKQTLLAQAERARLRDLDSGDRSPLPSRSLFSGRKQDQSKNDDGDDIVYRPSNQLAPPSPGGMQRKKSTSSGHTPVTGDIQLRMTYERCTLTLQVIKARNLKPADKSGFSDPYCKLNLVPGRASEYKYRTRHIMQTLNPEWKETFTFQSIDPNEIHHKQIEITVWDWDRLSADDFLGEIIVDLADPVHLDGTKRWYVLGERRPGMTDDQ